MKKGPKGNSPMRHCAVGCCRYPMGTQLGCFLCIAKTKKILEGCCACTEAEARACWPLLWQTTSRANPSHLEQMDAAQVAQVLSARLCWGSSEFSNHIIQNPWNILKPFPHISTHNAYLNGGLWHILTYHDTSWWFAQPFGVKLGLLQRWRMSRWNAYHIMACAISHPSSK